MAPGQIAPIPAGFAVESEPIPEGFVLEESLPTPPPEPQPQRRGLSGQLPLRSMLQQRGGTDFTRPGKSTLVPAGTGGRQRPLSRAEAQKRRPREPTPLGPELTSATGRVLATFANDLYDLTGRPYAQIANWLFNRAGFESEALETLAGELIRDIPPSQSPGESLARGAAHVAALPAAFFTPGGAGRVGAKLVHKAAGKVLAKAPKVVRTVGEFGGGITGFTGAVEAPRALEEGVPPGEVALGVIRAPLDLAKAIKDSPGEFIKQLRQASTENPEAYERAVEALTPALLGVLMVKGLGGRRRAPERPEARFRGFDPKKLDDATLVQEIRRTAGSRQQAAIKDWRRRLGELNKSDPRHTALMKKGIDILVRGESAEPVTPKPSAERPLTERRMLPLAQKPKVGIRKPPIPKSEKTQLPVAQEVKPPSGPQSPGIRKRPIPGPIPEPTAVRPPTKVREAAKQPWEMTRVEFESQPEFIPAKLRKRTIDEAIADARRELAAAKTPMDKLFAKQSLKDALEAKRAGAKTFLEPVDFDKRNPPTGYLASSVGDRPGFLREKHIALVNRALRTGKPVPPAVLADYPDLKLAPKLQPREGKAVSRETKLLAPKAEEITLSKASVPGERFGRVRTPADEDVANKLGGATNPRTFLKKFIQTVPEFRDDPKFVVRKGKLVHRDGGTFTLEPGLFGLKAESLSEGQVVRVDIASFGLKPLKKPILTPKPKAAKGKVEEARPEPTRKTIQDRLKDAEARAQKDLDDAIREIGGETKLGTPLGNLKPKATAKAISSAARLVAIKVLRGGLTLAQAMKEIAKVPSRVIKANLRTIQRRAKLIVSRVKRGEDLDAVMAHEALRGTLWTPLSKDAAEAKIAKWLVQARSYLNTIVQFPDPPSVRQGARMPAPQTVLDKFADEIKRAKPLRGQAEALKARERSRREAIMRRIQASGKGEATMLKAARTLAGQFPTVGFEPVGHLFTRVERDALHDHIRTHEFFPSATHSSAFSLTLNAVLDHGHLPRPAELTAFEAVFGSQAAKALLFQFGIGKRALRLMAEVLNTPRSILTSFDLSATFRQSFDLWFANPVLGAQSVMAQLRAFANEEYTVVLDRAMRRDPKHRLRENAGLDLTSADARIIDTGNREEVYQSHLLQRVGTVKLTREGKILLPLKLFGMGIRASERAYVTQLNQYRSKVFDYWAARARQDGFRPDNPKDFKHFRELANFINASTGRGKAGPFKGKWWNAILFAPRFVAGRFERLFYRLPKNILLGPSFLRRFALRQLVGETAFWLGTAALVKLAAEAFDADIDVELDPRSSDFLKMRIGNTRIDLGAGYGQVIRVVARVITSQTKSTTIGKVRKSSPLITAARFAQSKLAPVPGTIVAITEGKTFIGEKTSPAVILKQLAVPIVAQTLMEVVQEHGARGIMLLVPEIAGFGVGVHQPNVTSTSRTRMYDEFWSALRRGDDKRVQQAARRLGELGADEDDIKSSARARKVFVPLYETIEWAEVNDSLYLGATGAQP